MELLAPAGNLSSAYAAFKGGADAIYLGGKSFSARASAENFTNEEITEITQFAHSIKKKVYVTLNTLIFQDEFFAAVEFAKFLYSINVDGIIIQDLGLAHYLHTILPDLPLNASTQLNCHNIKQAKALIKIGFKRIVLARESNLEFAKRVKELGVEVEVFGHGALCVCYSGNCLMSSFIGDRSGNRGRCAQPCRMQYELLEDGKSVSDNKFLLSTKDLMSISNVDKFIEAGIDSLKLEGRLKSDEYIYSVSKAYRHAIDKANGLIIKEDINNLTKIFSRKFSKGYVFNESPFSLLNIDTSSHQGEVVGKVVNAFKNRVKILLSKDLNRLDGIRFNSKEQFGFTVENIFINREPVEHAKAGQYIELSGIDNPIRFKDVEVIKTKDYLLTKTIENELKTSLKAGVNAKITVRLNKPLTLEIFFDGNAIKVEGEIPLPAEGSGTPKERIIDQLKKTGSYPYEIIDCFIDYERCYVPISSINSIRNQAFDKLLSLYKTNNVVLENPYFSNLKPQKDELQSLIILESNKQAEYLNELPEKSLLFSFDDELNKRELRVTNSDSFTHRNELLNFPIEKENKGELIASQYCNITNSYTLDCYYSLGFTFCMLSTECDFESIKSLINDFKDRHSFYPRVGMITYGKLDLMVLKSCPIGTVFGNKGLHCNRCHNHEYELVDRVGARYKLIGDANCTTRLLNDKPICLFKKLSEIREENITPVILLVDENKNDAEGICASFNNETLISNTTLGHFNKRPL